MVALHDASNFYVKYQLSEEVLKALRLVGQSQSTVLALNKVRVKLILSPSHIFSNASMPLIHKCYYQSPWSNAISPKDQMPIGCCMNKNQSVCSTYTWPSYLTDLLSLRLIGAVGARNYFSSSFSRWALRMTRVWTQYLSIVSQMFLPWCYPAISLHNSSEVLCIWTGGLGKK